MEIRDTELTCILYGRDSMKFYETIPIEISMERPHSSCSYSYMHYPIIVPENAVIKFSGREIKEIIGLDDTTMKRIAKYNKEKELELTNAQIKVAELQLKGIRDKINRFKDKYEEILKFIDNDFNEPDDDDY